MRFALITAHRARTYSLIKINNIIIDHEKIEIEIPDKTKTSGPGRSQPRLVLPYFQEKPKLCAAST